MMLIVFGAGASYDSVPSRPPIRYPRAKLPERLPLANELFLDEAIFQKALSQFPQCNPIIPYLQNPAKRTSIESTLESLQLESESDIERKRQLAAIRYYLHSVIWQCEEAWNKVAAGITNYVTLLDQIRRSLRPNEQVAIVTFNYDRMIEAALKTVKVNIHHIPDYISHDVFKLFKLHGSVQWSRMVEKPSFDPEHMSSAAAAALLIQHADELVLSSEYQTANDIDPRPGKRRLRFPAIAVPVQNKSDFECPDSHLQILVALIPEVTKIIIVGWKGMDYHFLRLLKDSLAPRIPVCIVAQDRKNAEEVASHLSEVGLSIEVRPIDHGFTEFVVDRQAESFLRSQ